MNAERITGIVGRADDADICERGRVGDGRGVLASAGRRGSDAVIEDVILFHQEVDPSGEGGDKLERYHHPVDNTEGDDHWAVLLEKRRIRE